MAHVINEKCVGCVDTGCIEVCPVDCIISPVQIEEVRAVPAAERGARFPGLQLFIDPDECICCDACVPECPSDAIDDEAAASPAAIEATAAFFASRR